MFIREGQTQFFPDKQVKTILNTIASFAKGCQFIFSYLIKEIIPEYSQEEIEEYLVKWQFGLEPQKVAHFLMESGLQLVEDITHSVEKGYIQPSERTLRCLVTEHTVLKKV